MRTCQRCGTELPADSSPKRLYCRRTCREAVYEKRRTQRLREFGEFLLTAEAPTRSELIERWQAINKA
jgi:hypothetical protein